MEQSKIIDTLETYQLPPSQDGGVRPSRNSIYHTIRPLLFQHNAFWAQKRRRNISAHDSDMSGETNRQNSRGICRRCGRQNQTRRLFDRRLEAHIRQPPNIRHQAQSEKCIFGVPAGKLLGFIVSSRGIEANPAKIRVLSQLVTPTDLKKIQNLTGCVAALSRFISRLGEKALPVYRLLRRTEHFKWTDAATPGLEEIKAILATNPILTTPNIINQ